MTDQIILDKITFNPNDINIQKQESVTRTSSPDSLGLEILSPFMYKNEGIMVPDLRPPRAEKVDTENLREKLTNALLNPANINNKQDETLSVLYIMLLMNQMSSESEISKSIQQDRINRAISESIINGYNDLKYYNEKIEFINKVLNIFKKIAASAGAILPLLYTGSPSIIFLLIEVVDKINEAITGKSVLENIKKEINDKIIAPFLGKISDEIYNGLVSLGLDEKQAKVIADDLAKLILAGLLLSTLKVINFETVFGKEAFAQVAKFIEERLPFNKDIFNSIGSEILKRINSALPDELRDFLQPIEKEIEAAFTQFGGQFAADLSELSGSMIDIIRRLVSDHQLDADAVAKVFAVLESSLRTEFGKLLQALFSAAKDNFLTLEEKFIAEFITDYSKRISAALRAVLPPDLQGMAEEAEAAFARFGRQFAADFSEFSNSIIKIVSEQQLDADAVAKVLAVMQSHLKTEFDGLLNELFGTAKSHFLTWEKKFVTEFISACSKRISATLRAVLPPDLQELAEEAEAAFARFGDQFAASLSDFSGSMIDIIRQFASGHQLESDAVTKALAALENSLRTEFSELLNKLFSTTKDNVLALEEKYIAEFISACSKRISAALRAVLPPDLQGLAEEAEAAFARFGDQFAASLSDFSGSMIDIIRQFASGHQLDSDAVTKALAALESSLRTEFSELLNKLFRAAKDNIFAPEGKFVAEFGSDMGKRSTVAFRAMLPEALHARLQPLEKEIGANFASFANQYIAGYLTSDKDTAHTTAASFMVKSEVSSGNDITSAIDQNLYALCKVIHANVVGDALDILKADNSVKVNIPIKLIA